MGIKNMLVGSCKEEVPIRSQRAYLAVPEFALKWKKLFASWLINRVVTLKVLLASPAALLRHDWNQQNIYL
jgi:hypothetical protein